MTMKKTIAGALAGIVAVSAMASTASAAETSKEFATWTKGIDSYVGEFAVTTLKDTEAAYTFTFADATNTIDKIEVASVTIAGTKYEGDAAKLYTSVEGEVVTVKTVGAEIGKAISLTVKATAKVVTGETVNATWFNDATVAVDDGAPVEAADVLGTPKTNTVKGDKVYGAISATATELDNLGGVDSFKGLTATIANYIGDAKNVKLVVNFKDLGTTPDSTEESAPSYDQSISFASSVKADDFGIMINNTAALSTAAVLDADKMTITYDWDKLLEAAKLSSATGVVNSIKVAAKADSKLVTSKLDDGSDRFVITGITVVKNADEATVAPETKPEADKEDTTNPATGAAPVALALLPVALAAAVVVSKRK